MNKGKRPFYRPTHTTRAGRSKNSLTDKGKIVIAIVVIFLCLCFFRQLAHSNKSKNVQLSDQPVYTPAAPCQVELCNPSQRCSLWDPQDAVYEWADLVQQSVYRDLATVKVNNGCAVSLLVEDETPGLANASQWMPIRGNDVIDCLQQCRNLVAIKIQNGLEVLISQLESSTTETKETVLSRPVKSNTDHWVTLISQFSVNRLTVFDNVMEAWPGPISISIYLTEKDDLKTLQTFFADTGNAERYQRVSVTIVQPSYHPNNGERLQYPINHLRNLAIMAVSTPYLFVIDADFVPSASLYDTAQALLPTMLYTKKRTALVIPCFAMQEGYKDMPTTAQQVKSLVDQGIAYVTDPGAGHGPTLGLEMALSTTTFSFISSSSSSLSSLSPKSILASSYEVCYESQWEPYYILPRDAPLYDARFKNQGGDKQSHALQLNAEGYEFRVLKNVFMIHQDHPKMVWPGGGFPKAQKDQQRWNYFGGFMREMERLYGYNVRWPHGCSALAIGWQEQRRNTLGMALGIV